MELSSSQQEFLTHCEEIKRIAFSFRHPLIVHHHDADGITSGAIAAYALRNANKEYDLKCIKTLNDAAIEELQKEKEIIFTDLGSGNERVNELNDVVIIDHHQPAKIEKPQANCMAFGMDGGTEASSSTTAYLVFRQLVEVGVTGAVGDLQTPFTSLNRYMVGEGAENGRIKIENDLCFYGRFSRPLIPFLLYGDAVYIPGLSYREDRIAEFLNDLGIPLRQGDRWRTYSDLAPEEKRRLISALADLLLSAQRIRHVSQLIRESYIFPAHERNETYEANEFSTLLNACGRNGRADIGVRVCWGDRSAYTEASELLQLHRKNLREGIAYAQLHIQDFGPFYFLDARDAVSETIIGIVCGMWLRSTEPKPIFGISRSDNNTLKVSGRAPGSLIREGINIGLLLRAAASACGGVGGGHKAAGGATIPQEKLNEFLLAVGERLKN
ncbi:MAG TPA: DHH family phosphoesterase [Candidatus Bilamarchaeaceae archaeon]|nr:DHH family phosphoesterase [Candidatus Bilamarchaeaceae archaeon]